MSPLPDLEFPSEEPREVTLFLTGGDVLRFPMREMDCHLLERSANQPRGFLTVEYEDRFCCIPLRSVIYFEVSKKEYLPEEDDPTPEISFTGLDA